MLDEQTGQTKRQTLVLIDGHAIIHRAFHAVPEDLTTSKGEVVNATFGFTSILIKALTDPSMKPDSLAVAFPPFLSLLSLVEWESPGSSCRTIASNKLNRLAMHEMALVRR